MMLSIKYKYSKNIYDLVVNEDISFPSFRKDILQLAVNMKLCVQCKDSKSFTETQGE